MINALHSSRDNGTKLFQCNGSQLGWAEIYKMWVRECGRRDVGAARMVPKLRETHVIRDPWTKLNVAPAKIMQVCLIGACACMHACSSGVPNWHMRMHACRCSHNLFLFVF